MPVIARAVVFSGAVTLLIALSISDPGATQTGRFMRGDRVREIVATPASGPTRQGMVVMVVAVPGDRVTVNGNQLLVNDQVVEGFSSELVAMVVRSNRVPEKMMQDQYLVMGEYAVADGSVVLKWGTYSSAKLEPAAVSGK